MIHMNGQLFEAEDATIPFTNRGFQYGDAVFETLRVINNQLIFWEAHYFRLMASMRILRMEIPDTFSPENLEQWILDLIKANHYEQTPVKVKINVYRDSEGLYLPMRQKIGYILSVSPISTPFFIKNTAVCEVELYKDYYLQSGLLSTLKTNNKITQILASIFANENGYTNCLMLNENKQVVETTNGNIFLVKGQTIKTPPLTDGCLNGIIRKQLMEILETSSDSNLEEASISPFELQKADELFYTNAIQGIVSIHKYRKKEYATTLADSLRGKLNAKARFGE